MRFATILIVNLLAIELLTLAGSNSPSLASVNGQPIVSVNAQQTSRHKKAANSIVKEIDTTGLKELLAIGKERERPLLVNFWATWCEPCRAEFPDLVRVSKPYLTDKLEFVTVSLDEVSEIKTGVPQFLKQMKARMPAYLLNVSEPEEAIKYISETWSGELPATFLIDRQGRIVYQHTGRINLDALSVAVKSLMQ